MAGSSTYPATLDTFDITIDGALKLDNAGQLHSDIHEAIADALNKIEAELGANPAQAAATVAAFLAAIPIANLAGYPSDTNKILLGDGTWAALSAGVIATPPGVINAYAGSAAPSGWLLCTGLAFSRSTYSDLYGVIGTTYGSGDGSTTFNVPSIGGRILVGKNTETEFNALGKVGGEKTHALSTAELAAHTHTQNPHAHTNLGATAGYLNWDSGSGAVAGDLNGALVLGAGNPVSIGATTATNQNTGSGAAHQNLQPYITLNHIIKT